MKYPEGWELRKTPTEQYPHLHILRQRDRGAVAAINFVDSPDGLSGKWEFWPLEGAGATAAPGYGYQSADNAAQFAMKEFWVPVVERPDLSDLDDADYDYARWGV